MSEGESKVIDEREYVIPLGRVWLAPWYKRSPKAVRLIREFVSRHLKVEKERVRISTELNEKLWGRGVDFSLRRVKVRVERLEDGTVNVKPAD